MKRLLHKLRSTTLSGPCAPKTAVILISLMFHFQLHAQVGGNVLKLGGTSGYVEVPGVALNNGGPITIEFWSYVASSDVQESSVFTIGGEASNSVQAHAPWTDYDLYWDYGSPANGGRISADYGSYLNKWTHVALVSEGNDGGFKAIYLDGELATYSLFSDGPDERVSGFTIGKNGSLHHRGMIDEFRIWNVVRSEDEILLNKSTPATGFETNIMAVFHFDETAGSTATADASYNQFSGTLVGDAAIFAPGSADPAPYVLSCARQNPTEMQTLATNVTFRVTFSEAVTNTDAQDFVPVVTGNLNVGSPAVNAISTTVYDVTVPVDGSGSVQLDIADNTNIQDAVGNTCDHSIIDGEEYWIAHARFMSAGPGSGMMVSNTKISYDLTKLLASGTVTWTRTSGAADPGSPHVQALTGNELTSGLHENIILINNPNLVNGAVYTIEFKGIAFDDQIVPPLTITDIFFDRNLTMANADPGFDPGNGTYDVRTIAIQDDGKIMIGGGFTTYNNDSRNYVARLNHDGTLDDTFITGEGASGSVNAILVQPDHKVLIAGEFTQYQDVDRMRIARLSSDGSLDETFIPEIRNWPVRAMALQGDKIVIGGEFEIGDTHPNIARLNADGSTDETFFNDESPDGTINCMVAQDNGQIMIGGRFRNYGNHIARLNADGTVNENFMFFFQDEGSGMGFEEDLLDITAMSVQPDGKIVVAGVIMFMDGGLDEYISRIFRLNPDGTLDETFNMAVVDLDYREDAPVVHSILLQGDGRILIAGYFERCGGEDYNHIARLNADGSLDLSFISGGGADNVIRVMCPQNDGNILIGGQFSHYHYSWREGIARIDPALPVVLSSLRQSPATSPTLATSVTFRVTFSEAVENVGADDFTLAKTGNVTTGALSITAVSGAVYDVTVPSLAGSGTLRLDVLGNASITDRAENNYGSTFTTGESYTVGKNDQVITVEAIADKTVGDNPFAVNATSSSGLPVTITANSLNINVTNNQVTITSAGRATVLVSQSGNSQFHAATPVEKSFCIHPVRPVITASFSDPEHPVLTSSASSGNQWYFNNEVIASATQPAFQVTAPGTYKVQARADDCTSEFSADFSVVITGLNHINSYEKLIVSPNPAHDILNVEGASEGDRLSIISTTGNVYSARPATMEGLVMVDITDLAPGVYLLRAIGKTGARTTRFVKK